ncbi:CFI-box-CTERM domain-containing protein [Acidobacteriota bacterium]
MRLTLLTVFLSWTSFVLTMHSRLPFEEIAQSADLIFIGTVEGQEIRINELGNMILTDVFFKDIDIIHATEQSVQKNSLTIQLTSAGGCIEDLYLSVSEAPSFEDGCRYLVLMVDDGKPYGNPIIGGPQGYFEVFTDISTGEQFVVTVGRKIVISASETGIEVSKNRISHMQNGSPVYDKTYAPLSEHLFLQPPTPSDPSDWASSSYNDLTAEYTIQPQPLRLQEFINYIKNVALRLHISKKILNRSEPSAFIQKENSKTSAEATNFSTSLVKDLLEIQRNETYSSIEHTSSFENHGSFPSTSIESENDPSANTAGGALGWCGYHRLPFHMEELPESFWSYNTINDSIWVWNQFMDVYRHRRSDNRFGHNSINEFCGWVDDDTFYKHYGIHWNSNIAWCHCWYRGSPCGELIESDILFNITRSWTDNPNDAIGNSNLILVRPVAMHELAHSWGEQRGEAGKWGYHETYDYDSPTVVHYYYHNIVENGRGIHAKDANMFRRAYSNQTKIRKIKDVGVESYYASNGLKNSTTDASSYYPGDSIKLNNVTVENMSNSAVSDMRIRFYLSTDRDITASDHQMGSYWYWDSFNAEKYNVGDYSTTIPQNVPHGTYYVGIIITINGFSQDEYTFNNSTSFFATITIKSRQSDTPSNGDSDTKKKKCFIASAVYGSSLHPDVRVLQNFRDKYLTPYKFGRIWIDFYYKHSPHLATFISKHKIIKVTVRLWLFPFVTFCYSVFHFGLTITAVAFGFTLVFPIFIIRVCRRRRMK